MSDLGHTQPRRGGRLRLELRAQTQSSVTYALTLGVASERVEGVVEVALGDGKVSGMPESGPEWLRSFAVSVLRLMYRQRDVAGWPRRVTRWRAARDSE
jgi:hypothetical protein